MAMILVLRHGEAVHNLGQEHQHTFAGSSIDNSLAPEGIKAAKRLAGLIQKRGGCDLILASRLKRSKETASIISEIVGTPVKVIDNLHEADVGGFTGHTEAEVRKIYPELAESFYSSNIPNWSFPGGEDYHSITQRVGLVTAELKELAKNYQTIAVVGHAIFNLVWFREALPERTDLWQTRTYPHSRIVTVNFPVERRDK